MAVQIDFKPNRDLLDPKFESYRLSLDPLPVLKQQLSGGVESVDLGDDQYGYLHVRMAGIVNHLFQDSWAPDCVFFASEAHHIFWVKLSQDGKLTKPRIVWQLPSDSSRPNANTTISFPSADWTVVSDGAGGIYLLNTPSRTEGEPWQLCHTHHIESCHPPCHLLHGVHYTFPSSHQIECLLAHISRPQDVEGNLKLSETTMHFVCVLEWISFSSAVGNETVSWSLKRQRRLVGGSVPNYAAIDPAGGALCLATEREFSFIYDSQKQNDKDEVEKVGDLKTSTPPLYTYIQSLEDITVVFKIPETITKDDIKVDFHLSSMEVKIRGKVVLQGLLWNNIDVEASTWTVEETKLEVILTKKETGLVWQELVKGDSRGEEVLDPALVEQIHNSLAHLTSENELIDGSAKPAYNPNQLEECDISSEFFMFLRLEGDSHHVTHLSNIGGHQWLFQSLVSPEKLPTFCLRHDVDGLLWQPKNVLSEDEPEQFRVEHIATFPALGFVQASKQDRKYIVGSPDFSYAVLSDNTRHIYIYRQPESLNAAIELRNRKTGQEVSSIAKQHVVNLEQCDAILGLQACKHCIFVLSKYVLFAIKINES
ncbi:nudC domain-containing protein 1 isoform X1 [Tachypleus tridentatus]|uniref:nudC domain-containing protein 1 isoform X1 n=1 Tax=Tachypleus tridentatus TaxID=6853 RepID=UPI003FD49997